ncbi:AbrB/MazE/SpoVT family DNA-binding domain-containing protein [Salinigranum sp. GCM10025319]|uniref:AbrB/MazE/SpoVT family DNA-binding domain-containing protein n=1 Tax=Salinigranum sp. GCM10025319 TaxID=3252687 RepID=UPI00361F1D2F
MKRKVQQLGSSTLAVTVPAGWARSHDIQKGDEVIIQQDENGGSLLVVPDQPTIEDVEATIDVDALAPDALERAVVSQYVLGRQLIRIESDDPLELAYYDAVQRAEHRLMGLGIVEQADQEITVRCTVAPSDFDLPTLLGRLSRTERTMRTEAVAAVLAGDRERARTVERRHERAETLFHLFLRVIFATYRNPRLNQAVGLDTGFPLIGYRSVAQDISLMAGIAAEIASLVTDRETPAADEKTAALLNDLADALDVAVNATIAAVTTPEYPATETARDAFATVDERVEEMNEYLADERPEPLLELQRSVVLLERCAQHARDSLSVATHLAFRASPDIVNGD